MYGVIRKSFHKIEAGADLVRTITSYEADREEDSRYRNNERESGNDSFVTVAVFMS